MPPSGGVRTSLTATYGAKLEQLFDRSGGIFAPGAPLPAADPQPVRQFDLVVGQNRITRPRAYEPFGFAQLRAFSNVELIRLAIETRKDQIERIEWHVRPRDGTLRPRKSDNDARIRKVEKFLRKPDGVTPFATWMRMLVEELLAIDAPVIERRRNRAGELIGLDVVPGDTILLLVDDTGRRPLAPAPAYQQIIKGIVWADGLTTEDLIYVPRNRRVNHLYGFSPVEQIIVTLTTAKERQTAQLAHFASGNIPAGMANVPEGWTPDQIKDFQNWFDARLSGNQAERAKLIWGPAGSKYAAFKEAPIKDEFDEWLARIVCFAFALPPTAFVRQMNKGTAKDDDERAQEEGLAPLLLWAKRWLDDVIQDDLGHPDLEFAWKTAKEIDANDQQTIHDGYLRAGVISINEAREDLGLEPVDGGEQPMIYTNTGVVRLDTAQAQNDATVATSAAIAANGGQLPPQEPAEPKPASKPKPKEK